MVDDAVRILTLATAMASGVVGGVFYAFSTFLMRALKRLPAPEGVAAMQSINVAVINPLFLGVFVGAAVSSVVLAAVAIVRWNDAAHARSAPWMLAGAVLYAAGTFGVTMACNVPRNNQLARLSAASTASALFWDRYVVGWTRWNHVRTAAAVLAMGSYILAM
jgi:uncharacterized membrane protein